MTLTATKSMNETYNGWTNYHTWNVALYIQNEYGLYKMAQEYDNYQEFIEASGLEGTVTPAGVSWTDPDLDHVELNEMMSDL